MIMARKRWQAGGMTAAGLAGLWLAAPAPRSLPADRGPALQPAVVEQELLRRAIQSAAVGDSAAASADRRELALRALMVWQLPDGAAPAPADDSLRQIGLERWRIGQ